MPRNTALPKLEYTGRSKDIGGSWDTVLGAFVGPCKHWRTWLVGPKQFDILTGDPATRNQLLYSAEGAGKTTLMAQLAISFVIAAAVSGVTGNLGATAPTHDRLGTLIKAVVDLVPVGTAREPVAAQWGTMFLDRGDLRTITGHTIQFRSTKQQSGATGSPIQGWNWGLGAIMDELQNSIHAYPDVVARLRSGKEPPIVGTATAADSALWRNFRDSLSENWTIHRLSYLDTPFVHDSHWELLKTECSEREWKRRGLALDVGPERMVYTSWERDKNIASPPQLGAKDVTRRVLARSGRNLEMLIGHDPGSLQDCSVMLKAYQVRGEPTHRWYVVDEFRTKNTTSEEHAHALRTHLQTKWAMNYRGEGEPQVLVRCDPYGTTDLKTDRSVYLTFKQAGFDIRSAAFRKGKGNGKIPKEAGIEMINSLLCNANGERRLFVAVDERNKPCAPLLVESLELSERDEAGKAETQKKTSKGPGGDLSDFPAALRYALWQVERVRAQSTGEGMVLA